MRRRALALAGVVAVGLFLAASRNGEVIWRAAVPSLPMRVQGYAYALRRELSPDRGTPVPLPTPAATWRAPTVRFLPATPADPARAGTPNAARFDTRATRPTPAASPLATPSGGDGAVRSDPGLPESVSLPASRHEYQTWNNCGPATVSMALSHVGPAPGQAAAARVLKPDPDDKNVGPEEMAAYVRSLGLGAVVRVNGDLDLLRRFLARGLPVIVETWFVPEPGDEMGHYRVLVGYDDAAGRFVADDSYNGPGIHLPYAAFDRDWRVFNRVYVVAFPPTRDAEVHAVLGSDQDDAAMYLGAVARAEEELARAGDAFGWFNMGSSLLGLGDTSGAAAAFDRARAAGLPWRMLWYQFGPFEAYAAEGRWPDVAALAEANLRNAPNLEESHYWRGRALAATGDTEGAQAAYRRAVQLNPGFAPARDLLDMP